MGLCFFSKSIFMVLIEGRQGGVKGRIEGGGGGGGGGGGEEGDDENIKN